jgi:hypothetical protein
VCKTAEEVVWVLGRTEAAKHPRTDITYVCADASRIIIIIIIIIIYCK